MKGQWGTDKAGDYVFGKMTDKLLRNIKGIKIYSNAGDVYICHFKANGH